jgi:diaminohydroxyphosphoribosylaminopyrimidine deaminase/5-amino-6-(5-phosphoribosylamino)uracil reductase
MKRALLLARQGKRVFPNPMVGCVIVKENKIIGQGFHHFFGGPHAEINALAQAGPRARGSTLYVTLEPCAHSGKTPPCTDAIIRAGVDRVVVAMRDPNPAVRGKGILKLREHSIQVSLGLMEKESHLLNRDYLHHLRRRSPRVIAKAAMSLDGKIAASTGDSRWITSKAARVLAYHMRSSVDAILVGRRTVQYDNPRLTSHGLGRNPVRVVLDPDLKTSVRSHVYNDEASTILISCSKKEKGKLQALKRKGVLPVSLPRRGKRIPFERIIEKLKSFGLRRILIEGGGETLSGAFESGVVDDLVFFLAPKIIGGRMAKTPVEGSGVVALKKAIGLSGLKVRRVGGDLLLEARVITRKRRKGG